MMATVTAQVESRVEVYFDAPGSAIVVIDNGSAIEIPRVINLVPGQTYHVRATSSGYLPWEQNVFIGTNTSDVFVDMVLAPGWQLLFDFEEQELNLEYGLAWENSHLLFRTSIGWPLGSKSDWGGLGPYISVWYEYWPDEDRLEQLNISPYLIYPRLPLEILGELHVTQWRDTFFDLVYPSPTKNKVIYPSEDTGTYWFSNLDTGLRMDLAIPANSGAIVPGKDTFWFASEQRVILQSRSVHYAYPVFIEVDKKPATVTSLIDMYPWTQLDAMSIYFRVLAVSPSGRNTVVVFKKNGFEIPLEMLVYNGVHDEMESLGHFIPGWLPYAVWLDDNIVRAITPQGVIEYDVIHQTSNTLVSVDVLEPDTIAECLITSDGKHLFLSKRTFDDPEQAQILMHELPD
jgi:hypothetical protein